VEFDVSRLQARSLLVALAVLAGIVLSWWWLQQPTVAAVVVPTRLASSPQVALAQVIVDVVGDVVTPGVVRLPAGSRVLDAVAAAGGVRPGKSAGVNLARQLVDGDQIVVGQTAASSGSAVVGGKLNLNRATEKELEDLPGVGPVLAQRILDYRTAHGSFHSLKDLDAVSGVGPAMLANLKDAVSFG